MHMEGMARRLGDVAGPEVIDESIHRHHLARIDEKACEDGSLSGWAEVKPVPVSENLELPQDPYIQVCSSDGIEATRDRGRCLSPGTGWIPEQPRTSDQSPATIGGISSRLWTRYVAVTDAVGDGDGTYQQVSMP